MLTFVVFFFYLCGMKENQYVLNHALAGALAFSGLKQKELAERAGVSPQGVNSALRDDRPLSGAAFSRYMAAIGYTDYDVRQSPRGDVVVKFWAGASAAKNNHKKVSK